MSIEIKKSHKGRFSSFAEANGMSVQEAASHVLANKDSYSPERVKQANFAHNFSGKKDGGEIPEKGKPVAESTGVNITLSKLKPKVSKKQEIEKKNRELEKDDYIKDVVVIENPEHVNKIASILDPTAAMDAHNAVEKLVREGKVNPTDIAGLVANIIPGKVGNVFMKVADKGGDVAGYSKGGRVMGYGDGGEVAKKKRAYMEAYKEYHAAKKEREASPVVNDIFGLDLNKLKQKMDAAQKDYETELRGGNKQTTTAQKEPFSASGEQISTNGKNSALNAWNANNADFRTNKAQSDKSITNPATKTSSFASTRKTKASSNGLTVEGMRKLIPNVNDEYKGSNVVPEYSPEDKSQSIYPEKTQNSVTLRQDAVPKGSTTSNDKSYGGNNNNGNIQNAARMGADFLSGLTNYIIPYRQTKMGLDYLAKAGARPTDVVDPGFQESVDRANANAKFGFTPEEQAYINQQNLGLMNSEKAAARNYSGGSAGNAFNMERLAIGNYFNRGLESQVQNRNLQQSKQHYADTLNVEKANKMRQLYEDRMNGWQQNQMAGSQLLGAGLQNLIGAKMYGDELSMMRQNQNIGNSWLNNI